MPSKVRDVIKELEATGWSQVGQRGSHRHFGHPTDPGRVTVPGNLGDEIAPGTLSSIRRQAGLPGLGRRTKS